MIRIFTKYKNIIMYLIMGVLTTLINWITYAVSIKLIKIDGIIFGFKTNIFIANIIAWIVAIVFAYITNKLWVFESKSWYFHHVAKEFLNFIIARVTTGIIEIFGVPVLTVLGLNQSLFGIDGAVSKILISIVVIILNYILSKFFVFNRNSVPIFD